MVIFLLDCSGRRVAWPMLQTNIFLIEFYSEFCVFFSTKQHPYECMNLLKEQLNGIAEIKRKQNFMLQKEKDLLRENPATQYTVLKL